MTMSPHSGGTQPLQRIYESRLRHVSVAVPAFAVCAGVLASAVDLRFGLAGAAFVLGWSQLVGL